MNIQLQLVLITLSLLTFFYVIKKVKTSKVKIDDMILWIIGSIALSIVSIFPSIPTLLSDLLGFESVSNFIFFFIIGYLYIMNFLLSIKVSKLDEKNKKIVQQFALDSKKRQ